MKIFKIIKKNFKLLMRSKITALVVIIAPLLIILLAGVAFKDDKGSFFSIGVYLEKKTPLADSFLQQLENSSFLIIQFTNSEDCQQSIKESVTQACIIFPEDFAIEQNKSAELFVYADYSRKNFVFYLVESISSSLETKTSELSIGLTKQIIQELENAREKNNEVNLKLVQMKSSLEEIEASSETIRSQLNALNAEKENVGITDISSNLESLKTSISYIKTRGVDGVKQGAEAANYALDMYSSPSHWGGNESDEWKSLNKAAELNESFIISKYNETVVQVDLLIQKVTSASEAVKKIEEKLEKVGSFKTSASSKLAEIKTSLASVKSSAEGIKATLEGVNQNIASLQITSAERIIEPIKTNLHPVSAETSNINYMFPYLLMLIILFVSILLSSTTILIEKKSKAYFRNFTTPTSDFVFIIATYFTNLIIILLQIIVLFFLAKFALNIPVLNNIQFSIISLLIGITLFTAIGMGIGYWFSSQEAALMISIAVSSIFILVSNLILPLETMPETIQIIAAYNPYVMLSELLRQLIVLNIVPSTMLERMVVLAVASIVIFILIILIQKASKFSYFKKLPHTKKQKLEKKREIKEHKAFKLYERTIENEIDLLNELKKMDDETFATYVNNDKNEFYNWAKYVLKDKKLANRLKARTRQEMITAIEQK